MAPADAFESGDELAGITRAPLPAPPPSFLARIVLWLHRALLRLADAIVPGEYALLRRVGGVAVTQLVGSAARLGLADHLAAGPLSADDLAARTGTHPDRLHRALRALAHENVFALLPDGRFANNALSSALRAGNPLRARELAMYFALPSSARAWTELHGALVDGGEPFLLANGTDVWSYFAAHPDEERVFAGAMMGLTVGDAPFVATAYPWSEVESVCDVGGGRGTLLSELLLRHRHLRRGVLVDAPGVVGLAEQLLEKRGVADRAELRPGSFFEGVPEGCDAYVLKHVLHDFDDARAEKVLRSCRAAMRPGARLLVVDALLEHTDSTSFAALSDVLMMVVGGGRERSLEEFGALLGRTGFGRRRVFRSPMASIIEAVAV